MKRVLLFFWGLLSLSVSAQDALIEIEAKTYHLLTFSRDEENLITRRNVLFEKESLSSEEKKELDQILNKYDETIESIWDAVGDGCSWYCGGGTYKVTASSELKPDNSINYSAENMHDLNYKTVWAEGAAGNGIGEFVAYHFKPGSPRITEIFIANGYVKSEQTWFDNSRAKTLKMYVNGTPFAMLKLNDTKALQSFKLDEPLGRNNGVNDWIIKFEIVEIYEGDKYQDVVISELFFDGVDVH